MWRLNFVIAFCLPVSLFSLTAVGEVLKVVSLYGQYTQQNDLYKQIMIDASTYINDGRSEKALIRSGDQINVIHDKVLQDREYERQTLSKSVYQICNDIRSTGAAALIMPNDLCPECSEVGVVIGDAFSPVITLDQADNSRGFKMRPNLDEIEEMLTDVIDNFKWRTFIFLYEGEIGFSLVEGISAKAILYGWQVTPIELEDDFEKQAEVLKKKRVKNILLYVSLEDLLQNVVNVAFETGFLSDGWHWMFGNLNPPISKSFLEQKYRHNMAFLTRFKIDASELLYYTSINAPIRNWRFRQRAAYDALVAVAMAMNLHLEEQGRYPNPVVKCDPSAASELEQYLKRIHFRGASGDVSFNDHGDRVNYTIKIYSGKDSHAPNLAGYFTQNIKNWELTRGQKWPGKPRKRTYLKPFRQADERFIKILAVPEPPFFMQKGWETLRYKTVKKKENESDEPYEGYAWELIKEVKKVFEQEMGVDFNFQITLMSRSQYGYLDLSTGEWDGMMRELIDGDADIAIGSLTKRSAREKDVDVTVPWYTNHLKVAILHPSWTFEYPFTLVYPYHITAWAALVGFFILIALLTAFLGYYSPFERRKLAERGKLADEEGKTFTFLESFFYVLSMGFWQGYQRGPRSWSLRILTCFWFWFALSSAFIYASTLDSVFKFSKLAINMEDVHDLLDNDIHEFGLVRRSPSYDFYRYNKGKYRMVFDKILNSEKNLMEDRIEQAVHRIRRQWDGRYALLGDERILKYAVDRKPCRLYITGRSFGKIVFSFATPSGSPLRDQLTYALKVLKKRGNVSRILEMEFSDQLHCAKETMYEFETRYSFTIHDFQGFYYLMFIGMAGSVLVFLLEWLVYVLYFDKEGQKKSSRSPSTKLQGNIHALGQSTSYGTQDSSTDWI
ncbi:Glutamate receptor 4 [Holothuria leucospilota]|uniref:Glutamate receptor 4 n=1 Tax=Holothuria leucospilota TaxID=206669 RepID=A0A9Q0YPJ0_HOLLE|nr:Glutamate receptor 4 [Holothuria leucospilota]